MDNKTTSNIERAVKISNLTGYTGNFTTLGGGEINDTYLLDCGENNYILRIAKHSDQYTLPTEANTLKILDDTRVPKLVYFDKNNKIDGRHWIIESYISGKLTTRLDNRQFKSLGNLLAKIHSTNGALGVNIWGCFLDECKMFGNEETLKNHEYSHLKKLINIAYDYFQKWQPILDNVTQTLIHGDATPSNILVNNDEVSLIDWEFAKYKDPMAEFSTIYYEDMEYNLGKWRVHITKDENDALFKGYESAGGVINKDRINLWINFDKLGSAVFLYWRINQSDREATTEQMNQYKLDLDNLLESLDKNLPNN